MRRALLSGLLAVLASPPEAWTAAGFGRVQVTELPLEAEYAMDDPASFQAALPLHLLLLRSSGWDRALVEEHLRQLVRVYKPAGLRFPKAVLIEADAPGNLTRFQKFEPGVLPRRLATSSAESLGRLAGAVPLKARPLFFLLEGFTDTKGPDSVAAADFCVRKDDASPDCRPGDFVFKAESPALRDTVFLPWGINSPEYLAERAASPYSTAAHELLHVLTQEGQHYHDPPGSLMNVWERRGDRIVERDVRRLRASPLLQRL